MDKSSLELSFEKIFNNPDVVKIEFDPKWRNGTGYYNDATTVPLEPGVIAVSQEPDPNNRRIILVGTSVGTAVAFERYTPGIGQPFVVVSNVPNALRHIVVSGSMSADAFDLHFGETYHNVGHIVNDVVNEYIKRHAV
ncbi:MAG: hypothetical protein CL678_15470 [Bdellovibrionaceae bacterium]|nr:hypothetical protein [Pseudobdellovibrionaceae bacterium]